MDPPDTPTADLPDSAAPSGGEASPEFVARARQFWAVPPEPTAPAAVGRFTILRCLGAGGFGVVYLADDPVLGRPVALKVPRLDAALHPRLRDRFVREARAAALLDHPNIVPVHDAGEAGGVCYIASAYVAGPTLAQWLAARTAPVPVRDVAELGVALAEALAYTHRRGILHRDLKPGNILLANGGASAPRGTGERDRVSDPSSGATVDYVSLRAADATPLAELEPKVTDFGLAKLLDAESVTASGAALGTPQYMAPEQADHRLGPVGPVADVYALGAILYELIAGRPPFSGADALEIIRQVVEQPPLPLRRRRPDCPRDLATVVEKCLQKEPAARYPSADGLAADLRRFLAGEPVLARPVGPARRLAKWARRQPVLAALTVVAAAACLTVAVGGAAVAWHLRGVNADLAQSLRAAEAAELAARRHAYETNVVLAAQDWAERDFARAAPRLDPDRVGPAADLAGFEWYYLWREVHGKPRLQTWTGHRGHVLGAALTADGLTAASVGDDDTLRFWDVASGRLLRTLRGPPQSKGEIALSADGRRAVTAYTVRPSGPDRVALWDLAAGAWSDLAEVPDGISDVALSADGASVLAITMTVPHQERRPGALHVWDAATGRKEATLAAESSYFARQCLAISPDGRTAVVVGGHPGQLHVWDLAARRYLYQAEERWSGFVLSAAVSPDGRRVAVGGDRGILAVWDLTDRKWVWDVAAHPDGVRDVAWSRDGRTLATASYDRTVKLWSAATLRLIAQTPPLGGVPVAARFALDGRSLVLGTHHDRALHRWHPFAAGPDPHQLRDEGWALAWSPDSRHLVVGSDDTQTKGGVHWHGPGAMDWTTLPDAHAALASAAAFAPDGTWFATAGLDRTVIIWDAATRRQLRSWEAHGGKGVRALAISPDGGSLATGGYDGLVRLWDPATGALRETYNGHAGRRVRGVAFHPTTGRLASGAEDGQLILWDLATGEPTALKHSAAQVWAVAFSPDGATLAAGEQLGVVSVWDVAAGQELRRLRGPTDGVAAVAVSPDGRTLAGGGFDGSVRLWSTATGREFLTLTGHTKPVLAVAFRPDGRMLASTGHDSTVRFWRADSPDR